MTESKTNSPAAGATEPVPNYHADSPGFVEGAAARKYDKFFSDPARQREYAEFEAREAKKSRIASMFRTINESIEQKKSEFSILNAKISHYANADVALSIFEGLKNGTFQLEVIADKMTRAVVLKEHGPAVLKLAAAEITALEKRLKDFTAENKETLAEIGLI